MKIIESDFQKGNFKLKTENLDDLWYLNSIVDIGDTLSGQTERKIKINSGADTKTNITKKKIYLTIEVEKIDFHKYSNNLRISGKITNGPEDIARGQYHTFDIDKDTILSINKTNILEYQIKKLKEAALNKSTNILIVSISRENATFALLKKYGFEILSSLKGEYAKKSFTENIASNFFEDVAKIINDYKEKHNINIVVIGTINFWRKKIETEIKKYNLKTIYCDCHNDGNSAIQEIIKREEVKAALIEEQSIEEFSLIENLLIEISKEGLYAYGINEVNLASETGAIKDLLITDKFISKHREAGTFQQIETIIKSTDISKGNIHIISSDHEGGQQLDNLTGIAALLRYKH